MLSGQQWSAIDSIVFLQFSPANAIYTKSFDKNVCKVKSCRVQWHCGSSLLGWPLLLLCLQPYLSLPASSPFMANKRIHDLGTQKEVAKALRVGEKEGLVTIPNEFSFLLHLDDAKYHWQKNNSPTINYNRRHLSSWLTHHEFLPHLYKHGAKRKWEDLYCARKKILPLFSRPLHLRLL